MQTVDIRRTVAASESRTTKDGDNQIGLVAQEGHVEPDLAIEVILVGWSALTGVGLAHHRMYFCKAMIVKVTSKRQVTFPKRVMQKLRLREGDARSIQEMDKGITLQHRYGISKQDARAALLQLFSAGSVQPLNGAPVIRVLEETTGSGFIDRLIAEDYVHRGCKALTNDKRMAKLPGVALRK